MNSYENPFDTIRGAIETARAQLKAVEWNSDSMARMLVGNLRHVSTHTLASLKRELQAFDAHKKEWKK